MRRGPFSENEWISYWRYYVSSYSVRFNQLIENRGSELGLLSEKGLEEMAEQAKDFAHIAAMLAY